MKTAIAIFVKTPSLSPVKTRLTASIGEKSAEEFYRLSLKAIQTTLKKTGVTPYWAVGEKEGLNDPLWSKFPTLHTGEGGLGERQHHIYEALLKNHDCVLLIGADAPQLSTTIIEEATVALENNNSVLGPAHDGGYYLFGGKESLDKNIWTDVTYSTETTRDDLIKKLPSNPALLDPLTDVDTQNDLSSMVKEMPEEINEEQRNVIKWVTSLPQDTNGTITTKIKSK